MTRARTIAAGIAIGFGSGFVATLAYWLPGHRQIAECGAGHCAALGYTALLTAAATVGILVGAICGLLIQLVLTSRRAADDSAAADAPVDALEWPHPAARRARPVTANRSISSPQP